MLSVPEVHGRVPRGELVRVAEPRGGAHDPARDEERASGFERHLAPRRGMMKDLSPGLISTEAELAANGITTAALAQFYSWEGGQRGPEFATRMMDAVARVRSDS